MAITRAQIAKQLLEEGGRVGLRFGSKGPGQASREAGAREAGMGMGGKQRSGPGPGPGQGEGEGEGRNPMKQFEGIRSVNPVDEVGLTGGTANINFMNEARKKANPFGILTELPGSIGAVSRFLTPNPFGFKPKSPGLIGTDRSKDIPYWAQLGFSSEEEYLNSLQAQAPSITEQEPEVKQEEPEGLFRRFRAEGGPIGGEFDFESARQMYGLGKLVKKVTKTVKKIAKSPVGKAAIAYTLTGGLGNLAQGQRFFTGFTSPTSFLGGAKNIFSREGLRNIAFGVPGSRELVGTMPGGKPLFKTIAESSGIFGTGGQLSIGRAITAASLLPLLGIGTGEESEEEAEELIRGEGLDINAIRANPNQFLARRFRAEGGSMKEPVAKKTMPLLDMGGKEMDLRAEGGFVPIGRMEKADDVPARLSKNEFVFTADAVRNAGDGNVDKGAEVMYNMMKNLEAGGNVSKESQGLEGARKMFQTSQRLEEVL